MTSVDALTYGDMVFAKLRGEMLHLAQGGAIFGFVADVDGLPAGAVLARTKGPSAEVESIFVKPEYRGLGIARQLLAAAEHAIIAAGGVKHLRITYIADRPTTGALERTLAQLGWETPEDDTILVSSERSLAGWNVFDGRQGDSPEFTLFPWSELTAEDCDWIRTTQAKSHWIPEDLFPLQFEDCCPVNSLGIRHQGRPVGWVLTHRVAPDCLRWTCSYMHPDFQRRARILPAYREAWRLQNSAGISKMIFLVPCQHRGMLHWVLRWWPEAYRQVKTSRRCTKTWPLSPAALKETDHASA